ncbi:hypothetical protein Mycsm_05692 [Mycobacterium sp. JS623]|nr:hypothetical protein Mycsm_05692 [Mycobacterium sp. JS623]
MMAKGFAKLVVEGAVGALLALIVLIAVVSNLPAGSSLKQSLSPVLTPIAMATGLEQYWSMYAPNPPQRLEELEVHVTMADGADRVWKLPLDSDPIVGVAVSHRWRKLRETLYSDARSRPALAHWVVDQVTGPSERAVRVQIIVRTERLLAPGQSGHGKTGVETLYKEDLGQR